MDQRLKSWSQPTHLERPHSHHADTSSPQPNCQQTRLTKGIAFSIKNGVKATNIMEGIPYNLVIFNPVAYCLCVKPRCSLDKRHRRASREWISKPCSLMRTYGAYQGYGLPVKYTSPDKLRTALIRATYGERCAWRGGPECR